MRARIGPLAGLTLCFALARCSDSPAGSKPSCGNTICNAGETCCNASCGICVPGGTPCAQGVCGASACAVDADCRAFSDTCTSCTCRALHRDDPDLTCPVPPSQCLVDPCAGRAAACDPASRRCVLR